MIEKVISGGQSGADVGAWRAAKQCGIPCEGYMPRGFLTEDGPRPEYAGMYGALETREADYPPRTRYNVNLSEACLLFGDPGSPGGRLTIKCCRELGVSHHVVRDPAKADPESVADWLCDHLIGVPKVVMVAGNRESKSPGIAASTEKLLVAVFRCLDKDAPFVLR